jgi:transposase-like protein
LVTRGRGKRTAGHFFSQGLKTAAEAPLQRVTDKPRSYTAAHREASNRPV